MDTSPSSSARPADQTPARETEVEIPRLPVEAGAWDAYEDANHSYTCTRQFLGHFEALAGSTLGLVRTGPSGQIGAAFLFQRRGATARVLGSGPSRLSRGAGCRTWAPTHGSPLQQVRGH